jgi:bifunctional non-homologous end joining protein LigD
MKHIKPMLATLVKEPFNREGWIFEIKWDGFRAIADVERKKVELYSRNFISFNEHFPPIVEALKKLNLRVVLDGEVVVVDKKGKSHFQLLQNYLEHEKQGQLTYYVFDILSYNGKNLCSIPLSKRKKILKKILPKNKWIKYSDHIPQHGVKFFKAAQKMNVEGIIAKDATSPYRPGKRTLEWQKIKIHMQQEAVIGGFTEPRGGRKKFGALVLGVYEGDKLIYIGHTGGGFNYESLSMVYEKLKPLIQKNSPFETVPKTNAPVTWVKPKLVCEVTFAEWTQDGHMRQPIFLGLRLDKNAKEVKKEIPK